MEKQNEFREVQIELMGTEILELLLWSYAIAGGIFVIFGFVIFIQTYIPVRTRSALSVLFIAFGTLLLNLTARVISGYFVHFTILTIVNITILVILGGIFVYVIYQDNKLERQEYKRLKRKNNDLI